MLQELAHESLLHTIAEVSAAFVGFSLVAGVLGGGASATDRHRYFSIRDVAEIGLVCLAGALLPSALHAVSLAPETVWRLSSVVLSLAWLIGASLGLRRFLRSEASEQIPAMLRVGPILTLIGNGLLWWNVFVPAGASGRYVFALLAYLAVAGISFIAAVFHERDARST